MEQRVQYEPHAKPFRAHANQYDQQSPRTLALWSSKNHFNLQLTTHCNQSSLCSLWAKARHIQASEIYHKSLDCNVVNQRVEKKMCPSLAYKIIENLFSQSGLFTDPFVDEEGRKEGREQRAASERISRLMPTNKTNWATITKHSQHFTLAKPTSSSSSLRTATNPPLALYGPR